MDFYVDLAVAVLLRLVRDRRGAEKYYPALAKVYVAITALAKADQRLQEEIAKRSFQQ